MPPIAAPKGFIRATFAPILPTVAIAGLASRLAACGLNPDVANLTSLETCGDILSLNASPSPRTALLIKGMPSAAPDIKDSLPVKCVKAIYIEA
jgi:hypothetical protein